MKVSIILPFKNAAPWVSETIESIVTQSYLDWELICVNDFSTDESQNEVLQYCHIDSRIHLFTNEQVGIIPALQLGLKHAKGIYVTRMDADDIMPKGRLERMVNAIKRSPEKSVITGKVRYFSEQEVSDGYLKYERWLNERINNKDHYKHIYRECVIASPNWITRKQDLIDHHIFDELNYPEDYDMVFRWKANGFQIIGLDIVTLLWREHPARTSRNSDVYDQASFFQLKLHWFSKFNDLNNQTICLIGSGQKGKIVANYLIENHIEFNWYDLKYEKYNTPILSKPILNPDKLRGDIVVSCIFPPSVASFNDFLTEKGFTIGKSAWFF